VSVASPPTAAVVVLVTAPDAAAAEAIARALVEERLVACAASWPGVTSVYRWQGRVETATEVQLVLKTASSRVEALVRRVQELHPYEVPEVLVLPVHAGLPAYLQWIVEQTEPPP
jgi:periplasmic divalent cation tolerance protein